MTTNTHIIISSSSQTGSREEGREWGKERRGIREEGEMGKLRGGDFVTGSTKEGSINANCSEEE